MARSANDGQRKLHEVMEEESHSLQAADKGKDNVTCFKGGGKGSLAENVSFAISRAATCAKALDTMGEIGRLVVFTMERIRRNHANLANKETGAKGFRKDLGRSRISVEV